MWIRAAAPADHRRRIGCIPARKSSIVRLRDHRSDRAVRPRRLICKRSAMDHVAGGIVVAPVWRQPNCTAPLGGGSCRPLCGGLLCPLAAVPWPPPGHCGGSDPLCIARGNRNDAVPARQLEGALLRLGDRVSGAGAAPGHARVESGSSRHSRERSSAWVMASEPTSW